MVKKVYKADRQVGMLRLLARANGVATSYIDYKNKIVKVSPAILCGLIKAIADTDITEQTSAIDLEKLYRNFRQQAAERILPTSMVAWDGKFLHVWAWVQADTKVLTCRVIPEDGSPATEQTLSPEVHHATRTFSGKIYKRVRITWDAPIPFGYYRFRISTDTGANDDTLLISAPAKFNELPRCWGAFAPVYSLWTEQSSGLGSYSDLLEAARVTKKYGGEFFGTLPLLPVLYEGREPEVSPYSPVSRLFWNEIYLDPETLPGPYVAEKHSPIAYADVIDYQDVYAAKKEILRAASRAYFCAYPDGDEAFQEFVTRTTHLGDYADFCARRVPSGNYDEDYRYHQYCQYACHMQLLRIKKEVDAGQAATLYLDYTVGVHPSGFDALRLSGLFLKKYQVGAPPDMLFNQGQGWGFEPLHPRRLEASGFQYLRESLHHYFQYAKLIRIDHIMSFFRLYCIPDGLNAKEGTYIYYNLNAQLGVLSLEAWRHGASVIGEDLGTVPERIKSAMQEHRVNRMWVGQFNIGKNLKKSFSGIDTAMLAVLNTHDTFPFASYATGADLKKMHEMKFLNDKELARFVRDREKNMSGLNQEPSAFLAAMDGIIRSKAQMVMINIEDLWEETEPQNMPGTVNKTNWSRKFAHSIEAWAALPLFQEIIKMLNHNRMSRP